MHDPTLVSEMHFNAGVRQMVMAALHWQSTASTMQARPGVYVDQSTPGLVEAAVSRGQARLSTSGALAFMTGKHTGRSPKDRFIVRDSASEDRVDWGAVNQPIERAGFERLLDEVMAHLDSRDVFVQNLFACADPEYRLRVRVVSELASHVLFARTLFIPPTVAGEVIHDGWEPDFTILHAPAVKADPERHGTRSETAIVIDLERQLIVVTGSYYAGEIKKSVFSVLQYLLPQQGVATMHCSANLGAKGDVAIFFGLSGTGKTTLSADPKRAMIGDDEHGWSDNGVFNFEGGLYAKVIGLSADAEPDIYAATNRFGAILENVTLDEATREPDFKDDSHTENTRSAFPIAHMPRVVPGSRSGHPSTIVMLTADAFGVLPPVARLTPEQAAYYFLSGYTAKVAGTERGVTEPEATFSTCFGAPFLPLNPITYADLLIDRIRKHEPSIWLVNTGWTGGRYGQGHRISLKHTRNIIDAITTGGFNGVEMAEHSVFGFAVPAACPDVPADLLDPRSTWADPTAYDASAARLAASFRENFTRFADDVSPEVLAAGPKG
jgi:phosphoenolpyruvate carboxykinase (ATP)